MIHLALAAVLAASGAAKPRLVVLDLQAAGVDAEVASAMTQAVTQELASRGLFEVASSSELRTLIGQQRQRQMLGCSSDTSCLTELAGAAGARFILSGSLARLGTVYQLSLQTLDSERATPIGRATRITSELAALRLQLPYAVAEATATPLPPPPSRALPYTLMTAGGVVFLGGSLSLFLGLTQEAAIARELATAQTNPAVLRPLPTYLADQQSITVLKIVGVAGLAAGTALAAAGLILNPPSTSGGTSVSVLPNGRGATVIARW